jgi:glycosyltransferase involved in cell wall biosynthesis
MKASSKITFVSNTDILNAKGGWDGLGNSIFNLFSSENEVVLLDKISPKVQLLERIKNKILKEFGLKRNFFFFSKNRLQNIADICSYQINDAPHFLVFHGSTPWVSFKPVIPYIVFLDCSFNTYIDIYHNRKKFSKRDIQRIVKQDQEFLLNSIGVFFTSKFALIETQSNYNLPNEKVFFIGQGPSITFNNDEYDSSKKKKQFLFIATDFVGKGGNIIYQAFCQFYNQISGFKLVIVGQRPPDEVLKNPNVSYMGFIDKSVEHGIEKLKKLYVESYSIIIFSIKDIAPLVIVEAGYSFCPTIGLDFAATSEMINHESTGYLIQNEIQLLESMLKIAKMSPTEYKNLCCNAYSKMNAEYNWQVCKDNLNEILTSLSF